MYSSGRFRLSLQCKRFFIFWSLLTVMVLAIYSKWNSLLQYNLVLVIFTKLVAYNIPINCSISSRVNFSRVAGVTWIDYLLDSSKMKSRMELSKKNLIERIGSKPVKLSSSPWVSSKFNVTFGTVTVTVSPDAQLFLNFVILSQIKRFLKVFMLCAWKRIAIFFTSVCFGFLPNWIYQFFTSNCRAVFNFLKF